MEVLQRRAEWLTVLEPHPLFTVISQLLDVTAYMLMVMCLEATSLTPDIITSFTNAADKYVLLINTFLLKPYHYPATPGLEAIRYTWGFYDHALCTHAVDQLLESMRTGISLVDRSSFFIEALNHEIKVVLEQHSNGHTISMEDLRQALVHMCAYTHPDVREHMYRPAEYRCSVCNRPKRNHICIADARAAVAKQRELAATALQVPLPAVSLTLQLQQLMAQPTPAPETDLEGLTYAAAQPAPLPPNILAAALASLQLLVPALRMTQGAGPSTQPAGAATMAAQLWRQQPGATAPPAGLPPRPPMPAAPFAGLQARSAAYTGSQRLSAQPGQALAGAPMQQAPSALTLSPVPLAAHPRGTVGTPSAAARPAAVRLAPSAPAGGHVPTASPQKHSAPGRQQRSK